MDIAFRLKSDSYFCPVRGACVFERDLVSAFLRQGWVQEDDLMGVHIDLGESSQVSSDLLIWTLRMGRKHISNSLKFKCEL